MDALEPVNALADESPGFVWRLQDDTGDATSLQFFADPLIIINMSVWESIDALFAFAYKTPHVEYFRRRREWFDKFESMHLALWWVEPGTAPTPEEGLARLDHLNEHGPTPHAFTFKKRFEPQPA